MEWSSDNKAIWDGFAKELLASLNNCFVDVIDLKRFKMQREKDVGNFSSGQNLPFIQRQLDQVSEDYRL